MSKESYIVLGILVGMTVSMLYYAFWDKFYDRQDEIETELDDCPKCNGNGYIDESWEVECPDCRGSGLVETIIYRRERR